MINLVIFNGRHGASRTIELKRPLVAAALSVALAVPMALGGAAVYWWTDAHNRDLNASLTHQLQEELEAQKEKVADVRLQTGEHLDALTAKLGEMQARLLRLDALGKRLTTLADLDEDEFNFDQPPAVGGPELDTESVGTSSDDLMKSLDDLSHQIEDRQQQLQVIESLLSNRQFEDQVFIAGRPIRKGWLSSHFGRRIDPFTGRPAWHEGVDMAGKDGSDIIASAAGVVVWAGPRYGYGNLVEIDHGNGYTTRYGHAKEVVVNKGDIVKKGQVIALMGSTGRSTGPHVHYEVRHNGRALDPAKFIYRSSR